MRRLHILSRGLSADQRATQSVNRVARRPSASADQLTSRLPRSCSSASAQANCSCGRMRRLDSSPTARRATFLLSAPRTAWQQHRWPPPGPQAVRPPHHFWCQCGRMQGVLARAGRPIVSCSGAAFWTEPYVNSDGSLYACMRRKQPVRGGHPTLRELRSIQRSELRNLSRRLLCFQRWRALLPGCLLRVPAAQLCTWRLQRPDRCVAKSDESCTNTVPVCVRASIIRLYHIVHDVCTATSGGQGPVLVYRLHILSRGLSAEPGATQSFEKSSLALLRRIRPSFSACRTPASWHAVHAAKEFADIVRTCLKAGSLPSPPGEPPCDPVLTCPPVPANCLAAAGGSCGRVQAVSAGGPVSSCSSAAF
jgi:hypothetical protein